MHFSFVFFFFFFCSARYRSGKLKLSGTGLYLRLYARYRAQSYSFYVNLLKGYASSGIDSSFVQTEMQNVEELPGALLQNLREHENERKLLKR